MKITDALSLVCLGAVLATLALWMTYVLGLAPPRAEVRRPFDPAGWRVATPGSETEGARLAMIDDLQSNWPLFGEPRSTLHELLGPPERVMARDADAWFLDRDLGDPAAALWLVVLFDQEDRAREHDVLVR